MYIENERTQSEYFCGKNVQKTEMEVETNDHTRTRHSLIYDGFIK